MTTPHKMVEAVLNGEYRMILPEHRAARPEWFDAHGWEKKRMSALCQCIRALGNPLVYYVGAELGELAAIAQMQGAELALFEPNPLAWPQIKAIWDANDLHVPVCWPGFASRVTDTKGRQLLQSWPAEVRGEIVGAHGFKELHLESESYPQIRLEEVAKQWKPPQIITMDVEGSEFEVLRGAEGIIDGHKPHLFISVHPEFLALFWNQYSRDLRNWVIDKGYRETLLAWDHEAHFYFEPL